MSGTFDVAMLDADRRLIELFLEVAAIDGVSARERRVADHVLARLRALGLQPEESNPARVGRGDSGNVTCTVGGADGDRALIAHLDTARSTAGLRAKVLPDRVVSDGSSVLGADNRLGVAILLHLAERVARGELEVRPFHLAFTVQEETTLAGSAALEVPRGVRMGFVFDSGLRPGNFVARSYGARRFQAVVLGRAAHSGISPEKGIDAVRVAARAVARLPLGRIDDTTTANIGTLHGGSAINVVPERAEIEGEVRSLDPGRVDRVVSDIRAILLSEARDAGAELRFESAWDFHPYEVAAGTPAHREIVRAIGEAGLTATASVSAGGSDANVLNARGLPTVNLGIGAQNAHGDDEFVLLEDFEACARIAGALVRPVDA